jgi:hypothetical protein
MNTTRLTRMIVAVLIVAMLGGAYLIVARNDATRGAKQETPSGFFH